MPFYSYRPVLRIAQSDPFITVLLGEHAKL
jgi:hypothetical protein